MVCRMRNRHGKYLPNDGGSDGDSNDIVFNSQANIDLRLAQFIQDDYANLGLGGELSRIQFKIFDINEYNKLDSADKKCEYLNGLPYYRVNQFSGELRADND